MVVDQTIDIPRILVVPKGDVSSGFQPFSMDTAGIHYQPVDRDLLIQHLRTHEQETLSFSGSQHQEQRLEDYLVRGLIDYDDISYDDHADLLYDLAGQMVKHLLSYLSEEDARNVLIYHQRQLVEFIHVQMQAHYWEKATGYDVVVRKGCTELRPSAYTAATKDAAVQWCSHATSHTMRHGGKPWTYLLVPHDAVSENMTLAGLANQFRVD